MFSTSTLDICKGNRIEIDGEAYPYLAHVLDEVRFNVIGGAASSKAVAVHPRAKFEASAAGITTRVNNLKIEEEEYDSMSLRRSPKKAGGPDYPLSPTKQRTLLPIPGSSGLSQRPKEANQSANQKKQQLRFQSKHDRSPPSSPIRFQEQLEEIEDGQYFLASQALQEKLLRAFEGRKNPFPTASSRSVESSQSSAIPDVHFNVKIHGPDGLEAAFKTRGKHTIKKVLAGACNTFGLDYERAKLILVLSEPEEGHDVFYCEPEETMSSCGIIPGATLIIHVEPESEPESKNRYEP